MSKFSEKCKELLTENGYNVYRLSQAASLERTTLQRSAPTLYDFI